MVGIKSFGVYVPRLRLERASIAEAHRWMAPSLAGLAKGYRSFASWDEDAVTMAVEAARGAGCGGDGSLRSLTLCSTSLPFSDLQNASVAAAALRLRPDLRTLDIGHSQRAATSALLAALEAGNDDALIVATDMPPAKPASVQEMTFGAGAAAFVLGISDTIALYLGGASRSEFFVDHFREEGSAYDYQWEERWIREEGYLKIVPPVVADALARCNIAAGDLDHFVLAAPSRGIAEAVARKIGFAGKIAPQLSETCGYTGAAHPLLLLAQTLDEAVIGARILLVGFGQGADAIVLEKTAEPPVRGLVHDALADAIVTKDYLRMASFRGAIDLEWGMRAERDSKTALTEAFRSNDQIMGFVAGHCRACSTMQFPQLPYCVNPACGLPADYAPVSLVDEDAAIVTVTADWLSYYPNPPLYVGFVQFANDARVLMEMADVGPDGVEIGQPVEMVFRIKELDRQRDFRRYFWKARPAGELRNA